MNKIIIELTEFNRLYFDNESEQYLHFADLYREKLLDLFYKNFVFRLDMFSPLPVLEIGQDTGILAEAILQSGLSYKEEFFKLAHSVGLEIIRFIDNEDKESDHTRHWIILVCRKKI